MQKNDEKEARTWGMFCHLAALSCWVGVPFGNIVGPLIVWLIKKDDIPKVDEEGKESLNFEISITIYLIVAGIMCIFIIGIPILIGLLIAQIVLVIMASVKISNGETYKYPFTIRFID
ncbi:MAG: DUF4870 domain-containing protein [bacterium]